MERGESATEDSSARKKKEKRREVRGIVREREKGVHM